MNNFCILDLESTYNHPTKGEVVAIAILKTDFEGIQSSFYHIIKPQKKTPPFFEACLRFKAEALETAPFFEDIAEELLEFLKDSILVGFQIRAKYALLRNQFRILAKRFVFKHIELEQLLEPHFSLQHTKTISSVCSDWDIPFSHYDSLEKQSKSVGQIWFTLLEKSPQYKDPRQLRELIYATKHPPHLPKEKVAQLPNATGVYYFFDHRGRVIYLGKSKTIRTRVLNHFNSDLEALKKQKMKAQIYDLQYKLTGSELIALLLESDEIKRFMPTYNRAQKRRRYKYGLYLESNEEGYWCLSISLADRNKEAIVLFSSRWGAMNFVLHSAFQFDLYLKFCGLGEYEPWWDAAGYEEEDFRLEPDSAESHNGKVAALVEQYRFPHADMLIVDEGRSPNECSIVLIENHRYLGYSYLMNDLVDSIKNNSDELIEAVKEELISFRDNPDVQGIIRGYLRKNKEQVEIIPLSDKEFMPWPD